MATTGKTSKSKQPYTMAQKEALAAAAKSHKAFHKSCGTETLEVRWGNVVKELSANNEFLGKDVTHPKIRNTFSRLLDDVIAESGTDKEGVNLSGKGHHRNMFKTYR